MPPPPPPSAPGVYRPIPGTAADGTILASDTLLDVLATRLTHPLGATHTLGLKGLTESTAATEIVWPRAPAPHEVPLDADLAFIIDAWPTLPDTARSAILAMVQEGIESLAEDSPRGTGE